MLMQYNFIAGYILVHVSYIQTGRNDREKNIHIYDRWRKLVDFIHFRLEYIDKFLFCPSKLFIFIFVISFILKNGIITNFQLAQESKYVLQVVVLIDGSRIL